MFKATLLGWDTIAPEVRHFNFKIDDVEKFVFTPGQFISLVEQVSGKEITRAYSIASPRDGNHFSLCLNRVSEGLISPRLFDLAPGDKIDFNEPLGYFSLRHPDRHAIFIATGTGVAPFRSMLLEYLPRLKTPFTLLFGVRHEEGLLYASEFTSLAAQYPQFTFLPTISRPDAAWTGRTGRVQAHLDEALAQTPANMTRDVYICGLKEMVDDVRTLLKSQGFDRKNIIYEKYD